jgi:hypothetical protein
MRVAAQRLLQSLEDQTRSEVQLPLESERRQAWHYIPSSMMEAQGGRRGLAVKRMTPHQRAFALSLLNSALSHRGQLEAATIMALETILRDIENGNPMRDSEMYHVAVFGTPSATETWGWSFEGHHLSVNILLVDGRQFSATPSFWGSNPAIVQTGPHQGLEVLAAEQQLARKLVGSFDEQQKGQAIIAPEAPPDLLTAATPRIDRGEFTPPQGIAFEKLTAAQQDMLLQLVRVYASKYRQPILDQIAERTPIVDGTGMYFAWAGGTEPGQGHYYRIQTPHFLFEYDNTQNNANHIHAVWRSFDGDFGEDLLRKHYESSPHH